MTWLTDIKTAVRAHIIAGLLLLIALLSGVIWAAVPTEIWGRVSAAIPKRVLWALLGLESIAIVLEIAYVWSLRKNTSLTPHSGALWSKTQQPHCPACKSSLGFGADDAVAIDVPDNSESTFLKCLKCDKRVRLVDENGHELTVKEVRARLFNR